MPGFQLQNEVSTIPLINILEESIGAMLRFRLSFQRFLKPHKISLKKTKMLQKNPMKK